MSLGTAAGLSKLLPTGTTLAFQAMAPSFTRGGTCEEHEYVNFAFTWWLIVFLTVLCAAICFTDSITDKDGHTYYGVATRNGLLLFNHEIKDMHFLDEQEKKDLMERMKRMGWKWQDFLHAFFSAAVFLALAFCDAGVQRCLVRSKSKHWNEFLTNMPLAVGFLASFVFIIFPSTRNGIGEEGVWDHHTTSGTDDGAPAAAGGQQAAPPPPPQPPHGDTGDHAGQQSHERAFSRKTLAVLLRRTSSPHELHSVV
ncbi:hypothetical protein BAE44_0017179 [Dichanthelium oligosanthes]|uniref:Uncharacterized protein n=1 Tax=Dichanthelium oligosanthes TaxID=888268 RepID=A0A1E5V9H2_9POAL|nr:hypothetical protein BAE44_0017179 [Dichanthelium oligosanthes]